ncbi:uncharacterized protein TNCT_282471 [Trichonephila clavata]|uniref:Ig-like domain-containing protein n=1 Tax=Trichonephila clavata TaxID=2740835 RepID=A0A8X6GDT3_TRICU|nr:uncharacterized protein TNCT_282471 [Trichonephila clavata]
MQSLGLTVGDFAQKFVTLVDKKRIQTAERHFNLRTKEARQAKRMQFKATCKKLTEKEGTSSISWVRKRDKQILTIGEHAYTTDARFNSIHLDKSDIWNLEIRDTREDDSGVYECQVNTEPKMSLEIQLNILGTRPLYIKSGSPVNLTCHVKEQVGTVFLLWYLNGRLLDVDEKKRLGIDVFTDFEPTTISRLFIAKLSESGNFICQPSYAKPANITLKVLNGEGNLFLQL